jgi:hypothetical protein
VGDTFTTWDLLSTARWAGSGAGSDYKSGFNGIDQVCQRETGQYGSDESDESHRRGREWEREVGPGTG